MNPTAATLAVCAALMSMAPPAGQPAAGQQAQAGQQTFQRLCVMCHTVGGGRLVGPDLQGVTERRSDDWIVRFVQHSQQMVAAGDSEAVRVFEQYGRIVMPDHQLSADDVRAIVAYLRSAGPAGPATPDASPPVSASATDSQILFGRSLFQGLTRFSNGGPMCNSCHEVTTGAVIGGGGLARDLTAVFSRVGGPGIRAILEQPPFLPMQRAYRNKPLTEEEVTALVGFLRRADEEQARYRPRAYGASLLGAAVLGTILLLALYAWAWRGRAKASVNQAIYERQTTSS